MAAEHSLRENWRYRSISRSPDITLPIWRRRVEPAARADFEPWECPCCGELIGYIGRALFWVTGWHKNVENCAYLPTRGQEIAGTVLRWLALGGFFVLCLWVMWRVFVAVVIGFR